MEAGGLNTHADGLATILFGAMAALHIIWSIIVATSTGFTLMDFTSWKNAGYNAYFLASWIFKSI
jgi:hypothetical protein